MTKPMRTYDELYNDMLKSINVEETDQSAFDKEVAIVYAAQQVAQERERIKELESKLEYANALLAKYTPKDYGSDEPVFTHPDETED